MAPIPTVRRTDAYVARPVPVDLRPLDAFVIETVHCDVALPTLRCTACHTEVCDVENGDSLAVLAVIARHHLRRHCADTAPIPYALTEKD